MEWRNSANERRDPMVERCETPLVLSTGMCKRIHSLWWEVEDMVRRGADPFTKIPGICKRDRANHNTSVDVGLLRDVASTRYHNLVGRPNLRTDELALVTDKETEVLHVLPLLPPSRDDVPLHRSANDNISFFEQTKISAGFSRQAHDLLASLDSPELRLPLSQTEIDHILIGFNANRTLGLWLTPESHQREFRTNCLSTTGWSTDENVVVGSIQRLEDLSLDLVECFDGGRIDRFELFVMEGGDGKVLEVEEGGRWGELLGKDEMLERNRNASLRVQPSVGKDGDEVVRWNGVEHRNGDCNVVFHLGIFLSEDESIAKEDDFGIDILNEDSERLGTTMNLLIPTEVRDNGKVDAKEGTCDRLNRGLQPVKEGYY